MLPASIIVYAVVRLEGAVVRERHAMDNKAQRWSFRGVKSTRNIASPTVAAAITRKIFKACWGKKKRWEPPPTTFGTWYASRRRSVKALGQPYCLHAFHQTSQAAQDIQREPPCSYPPRITMPLFANTFSQRYVPSPRLDFGIQEMPNKKSRRRLVHIDIPEGFSGDHVSSTCFTTPRRPVLKNRRMTRNAASTKEYPVHVVPQSRSLIVITVFRSKATAVRRRLLQPDSISYCLGVSGKRQCGAS